jgi:hypothetical protein
MSTTTISMAPHQAVELSATLDGGDDVIFHDPMGREINVTHIMLSTDGAVCWREKSMSDAGAVTMSFLAGGWHRANIGAIFADGTDEAIGLHVMWCPA